MVIIISITLVMVEVYDTTRGIAYCLLSFVLFGCSIFGYSQYIITFLPPTLVLCISHFVALRIYLRRGQKKIQSIHRSETKTL